MGLKHRTGHLFRRGKNFYVRWAIDGKTMNVNIVIPPNTTARVTLPGTNQEPLEVSSGTYQWSYEYQDPDAPRALSVDNTIGEIHDNARAWEVVIETLTQYIPDKPILLPFLQNQSRRTLRQGLATLPDADKALSSIADAFAKLE